MQRQADHPAGEVIKPDRLVASVNQAFGSVEKSSVRCWIEGSVSVRMRRCALKRSGMCA